MNSELRRLSPAFALSIAIPIAALSGTLTYAKRNTASINLAQTAEPITEEAVSTAIEQYVRARYAGDVETAKSRTHHDVARRTVADTYWGQPSTEWVRPLTQDHLRFYADPDSPQRIENPKSGRCDITIFDIEQRSASAVVIMEDAIDYLHMIHVDGRWHNGDSAIIPLAEPGANPPGQSSRHAKTLEQISRDYCVGFYEIDGDKVQATCHPSLSKRSVEQAELSDGTQFDIMQNITWEEIHVLGETFNNSWGFEPDARCEVEIYEIRGNIAAAKMTGAVWFDYFHLMHVNDEWQIVNIMFEGLDRSRWTDVS